MTRNQEVVRILNLIADLLEIQEVDFKPRAYRQAALSIESLSEPIEDVYKEGKLEELPGIGKHIAGKIAEIIETGKLKYLEQLKREVPVDVESLTQIEGLGPKKISRLYKELNIKNREDLKVAAEHHKLQKLPGFGEKSEQAILQALSFTATQRMLLPQAIATANQIVEGIQIYCEKIDIAGSLRRRKETIGDIDILATAKNPVMATKAFTSLPFVKKILVSGTTKSSVLLKDNTHADLRIVDKKVYGAALQYFTGNKDHNIATRKIAIKKGYKLSEYGLFKGKNIIAATEEEIYQKLGMQYLPPELRENMGEIEAALKNKIPKLVELKDIQGDLHAHTNQSDGADSLEEMARAALRLKRKYLLITDHTGILKIAGGMNEKAILKHYNTIDKLNQKLDGITLLKGMEVNIMDAGQLDIKESVLKQADLVVASIHTGFKNNSEQITKRLLNAIDNQYVNIIAHPTGRLIDRRPAYDFDKEKVFQKAKDTHAALEINSQPDRLDLKDTDIKKAIEIGAKFVISSDAHNVLQLENIRYGLFMARRGWAKKSDILNTMPWQKMMGYFK